MDEEEIIRPMMSLAFAGVALGMVESTLPKKKKKKRDAQMSRLGLDIW